MLDAAPWRGHAAVARAVDILPAVPADAQPMSWSDASVSVSDGDVPPARLLLCAEDMAACFSACCTTWRAGHWLMGYFAATDSDHRLLVVSCNGSRRQYALTGLQG